MQRRQFVQLTAAGLLASPLVTLAAASKGPLNQRPIPSSGEQLPIVGMGTSRTFDADGDEERHPSSLSLFSLSSFFFLPCLLHLSSPFSRLSYLNISFSTV